MYTKKIYIYGAGKMMMRYKNSIPWGNVKGILDSSPNKENEKIENISICNPKNVKFTSKDIIVITTQKYYWEIREELMTKHALNSVQIVGLQSWLSLKSMSIDFSKEISPYYALDDIFYCLSMIGAEKVLSYSNIFYEYGVISDNDKRLYRWKRTNNQKLKYISKMKGGQLGEKGLSSKKVYDALVCMDVTEDFLKKKLDDLIDNLSVDYVVISLPYMENVNLKKMLNKYKNITKLYGYSSGAIYIIECGMVDIDDFKIYMVTHKKMDVFFNCKHRKISVIFAGAEGKESYGYLRDDIGDNISKINPWINECTALYWIWKHTKYEYVGLCHYRRMFLYKELANENKKNIIWPNEAKKYLQQYDIIVADIADNYEENGVFNTLAFNVQSKAVDLGMKIVRNLLCERQASYVETFDMVMHGVAVFPCNMFITRREILDGYCTWLFSFIIDAAKSMDIKPYDDYSKRIIGFIAERMLTVWLLKQKLRIKELPILLLE